MRYKAGDLLIETGKPSAGMFLVIAGTVAVAIGLGHVVPIVEEGPGEFLAEIGQFVRPPCARRCACKDRH